MDRWIGLKEEAASNLTKPLKNHLFKTPLEPDPTTNRPTDESRSFICDCIYFVTGNQAVEHWDNIQPRKGPHLAGRSTGPTESTDLDLAESNRELVRGFVQNVLIDGAQKLEDYLDADMIQHNPDMQDGVAGLRSYLEWVPTRHGKIHRVLAEGNFVLATRSG